MDEGISSSPCTFSAINVVPGSLYVACLKRNQIPEVSHALLNAFLISNTSRFFSFVQTSEEVTLILDYNMLKLFPKDSLTVYGKWKGLKVILGCCGYSESGIISSLSKILSDNNINIHYLATYSTDYILIPERKLEKAIRCLRKRNVEVAWDEGEHIESIKNISSNTVESPEKVTASNMKLAILPDKMCLASLKKEDYPSCAQAIMRLVFFPNKESSFFSYMEAEDEISMIMDFDSAHHDFTSNNNILIEEDHWRAVKRYEKLSLEEVGVVHAISSPLTMSGISLLYLSTYCSSYIMVREDKFLDALAILRKQGLIVLADGA